MNDETVTYTVREVRDTLGELLDRARYSNDVIKIAKRAKPFATVMSSRDGDTFLEMRKIARSLDLEPSQLLDRLNSLLNDERGRDVLLGEAPVSSTAPNHVATP